MSMQTLQTILCRAVVDRGFEALLLGAPGAVLREYYLDPGEASLLTEATPRSLAGLAITIEAWRRGEPLPAAAPELALAG